MSDVLVPVGTEQGYAILRHELLADPLQYGYAGMSDEKVAVVLNTQTRTRPASTFRCHRDVAMALTEEEYQAFKRAWEMAKAQSSRVASMSVFFDMPCTKDGSTGGIDFGHDAVREVIRNLDLSEEIKGKLLSLGEELCSRAEELGLGRVEPGHVQSARATQ